VKLLRVGSAGAERPAVLVDADVLDVGDHVDDYTPRFFAEEGIARLRAVIDRPRARLDRIALDGIRIGPPVARPGKIVCVGLNYDGHAREAGLARPSEPVLFLKASNTLVGPYDDVLLPRGAKKVDWEVELAIVIGRTARYMAEPAAAAEVIAGYADEVHAKPRAAVTTIRTARPACVLRQITARPAVSQTVSHRRV
jgi:2,4-didehydro-3-deoxy-L-rhamnonate hydrolase